MLPLNAFSPATLVLEDISVGVAGSVLDERIFVKWMGAIMSHQDKDNEKEGICCALQDFSRF
jgi:hypothetical protein